MQITKTLLFLLAISLSFTACKTDDDDDNNDLTTVAVGYYIGSGGVTFNVLKVDDTHVSMQISLGNLFFNNVTMNSENQFTLNTITDNNAGCGGTEVINGYGSCSATSISVTLVIDGTGGTCIDQTVPLGGDRQ